MSAGVVVPVTVHVGGQWAQQLKAIEAQSKAVGRAVTGIGNTAALGKLGDKLQATTEGLHKFRLGVEETVEQLFLFGAQGSALVNEIENIRDPLKRLELAQLALGNNTSALGKALTGVTQRFAEMKARAAIAVGGVENLTLIMGAATIAGGLLAGVIGGVLSAAYDRAANGLEKYIAKNKEAQALQEFTTQAADANAQKLGESLYGVTSNFKLAEAASTSFADKYLANAAKILQGTTTYSKAIEDVWGVQIPTLLTPAVDWIGRVGAAWGNSVVHLDKFAAAVNRLATPLKNTQAATQTLTQTFNGQKVALDQLKLALSTYGAQLDDVAQKARKATPYLDALTGGKGTRESEELGAPHFEAKRAGGNGDGSARRRRDAARRAFGEAMARTLGGFGERGQEGAGAAGGIGGVASGAAGQRATRGILGGAGTAAGGATSDADTARLAKTAASGKLLTGILQDAKGAASGLAGSLADVAAGLASGQIKAGDFGAAIKGAFGGIFKDLGRGFVLQGTALLFTPGGQAAGAGMIGAGLALSVLGGAMSRGSGASSGSGGGGAAASGAVAAAARQAATASPNRDTGPRIAILQVGTRELQGTLVELVGDGQGRHMNRRLRGAA